MNLLELLKDEKINYALVELLKDVDAKNDDDYVPHIVKFAEEHGVKVTHADVKAFLAKLPLSEEELNKVAGGQICKVENAIADATERGPLDIRARLRALKSINILEDLEFDPTKRNDKLL